MKRRNEVIDWHKYFTYENGKLYWKVREGKDRVTKIFNTRYAGTEAGCVRSVDGYITIGCNSKLYMGHRIIWEMFNGSIPDNMEIDHIDFNTDNNKLSNLQLLTRKQHNDRKHQENKGYSLYKRNLIRPYKACRTHKYFGTPCGAYMSYATAFLQGESNGDSR